MPITTSEVHVDRALSNISISYAQSADRFIASKIFPSVNVSNLTNKYHIFTKDQYLRGEADLRASGSPTRGANFSLSTGSYSCQQYGVHMDLDDYVVANADEGLNIAISATQYITEQLLLKREQVFAAAAFSTSTWTGSSTGGDITPGTLWSASSSTPIKDVQTQADAIEEKTGRRPTKLVLGSSVMAALKDNDDILDRVKYSERGIVTEDLLAALFGVKEVMVAGAINNTALEGATANYARVFDAESALLAYVPDNPGLMVPAAGMMFSFTGVSGADQFEGLRTLRYRVDTHHSERIEALAAFDFKVTGADLGAFFSNCVA